MHVFLGCNSSTPQGGLYRPRTKETREAYEALLAIIHTLFGEQPQVGGSGATEC